MTRVGQLSGITLECRDPAALADFYGRLTGWPVVCAHPDWCSVGESQGSAFASSGPLDLPGSSVREVAMSSPDETVRGEAAGFLARFPPFDDLGRDLLDDVAAHVDLGSFPAGTEILRKAGEPARHLFVIRSGVVELLDEGRVIEALEEGEVFGVSVLSGLGAALTARAREDAACYLIDPTRARAVMGTPAGLASLVSHATRWHERDVAGEHARKAGVDDEVLREIGVTEDVPGLAQAARRLPSMVAALLDQDADPVGIGHVVGITIDHLTTRAIELHVRAHGDPPAPFAWIALGSAARHEQALNTDQDHAIAYGDGSDAEAIDEYFASLAESVTSALEACGIERCRGNVMAINPAWRRTREGWRRRFEEYIADPDLMGARITGIAFDYRRVIGPVEVEPTLDEVIRKAREEGGFIRRLATTALESEPPLGRRGDIAVDRQGEHPGRIDVKHDGITIITNLARVFAILAGVSENRTTERLRTAASAGVVPDQARDDLLEAFRLLWKVRLEHHAELLARNESAEDFVDPSALAPITERALGGAFRVIATAQDRLAAEFGLPHRKR